MELPNKYKSWAEIWIAINKAGYIEKGAKVIFFPPNIMDANHGDVSPIKIPVRDIIQNVLNEIVENDFDRGKFIAKQLIGIKSNLEKLFHNVDASSVYIAIDMVKDTDGQYLLSKYKEP